MNIYDKIIFGAGIYGLYAASLAGNKGEKVLVLEFEEQAFQRASYINQARVHMGYHYPRSYSTAIKSAGYFNRFCRDFEFCIHSQFKKVYATSNHFSWSDAIQFKKFCDDAGISCTDEPVEKYFKKNVCDGAFLTKEFTYDGSLLKEYFIDKIRQMSNVTIQYNTRIKNIKRDSSLYYVETDDQAEFSSEFLLNATYASINQIIDAVDFEMFNVKYEICEVILCEVNERLKNLGITVMDGPFFSIMPFGKSGLHSLTSVTFTPHFSSYEKLPVFTCQSKSEGFCSISRLGNCNSCVARPESAWDYMSQLAKKYLKKEYVFDYEQSLFSIKPILKTSEIDDSRPTLIKVHSSAPTFISVLSGKINTIYDLEDIL